jgi:hypothetical protein
MDESVKMLVDAAAADLESELFVRSFDIDDACRIVADFMFRRYGVSNYACGAEVKQAIAACFDAHPGLQRVATDGDLLAWKPLA